MVDEPEGGVPAVGRFDVQPTASNHFSWLNSRLSVERTYLSWIRTGISLIGFGFTIVQFFQRMQSVAPNREDMRPGAPRDLGLALIATGIGALVIASREYSRVLKYLWGPQFHNIAGLDEKPHWTPTNFSAYVLILIGIAAFVSVFVRFP
jgi:putative membrane protein